MESPNQFSARLGELLTGIDIAMLTTLGDAGYPVSRPLSTQDTSYDGEVIWFMTERDSPKVGEIRRHPKVNLGYASKDRNIYLSIAGDARVLRDQAKIDELWSDALKAFFPKGKDDPNLVLLEVRVRTAEYWEGPSSLIGKLLTFVVARATGKEEVMGENRILDMTGSRKTLRAPPSSEQAKRAGRKAPAKSGPPAVKPAARKTPKKVAKKVATKATRKPVKKAAARRK